jgi:uncharacterized protein DUF4240
VTETDFWTLIELLDWDHTGDDEAVVAPVVEALAAKSVPDIEAFESVLAQKLFALDTEPHARAIGKHSYQGDDQEFSVDLFLYVRCCVVANGLKYYDLVLASPAKMPRDMEFEALLYIAGKAYKRKTGQEFSFVPSVSYETFSNKAGWAAA